MKKAGSEQTSKQQKPADRKPPPKSIDREEQDVLRELIARWRNEAGLSQRELSAMLDRSHNYIVKIETGVRGLEVVDLVDIIRILGRDLSASLEEYAHLLGK